MKEKPALKRINPADLVCMDDLAEEYGYTVHLAYARDDNLLFGQRIYRRDARLWLYQDLAEIVLQAARLCYRRHGVRFVLYDGLRTTDAQAAMLQTQRVQDNPQWLEVPRLLSPPGAGGHPRAMAVDIGLIRDDGSLVDMGCDFDFLAESPISKLNPAHRDAPHPGNIKNNRAILDNAMIEAAHALNTGLFLLSEEWWDFRMPSEIYMRYAPLSESDVPDEIKLLRLRE